MQEEQIDSANGAEDLRPVVAAGRDAAGGGRHLPRRQLAQRLLRLGRRAARRPAASPSTRSTCAAAASPTASASTSRRSPTTSSDVDRRWSTLAKSREPGLPVFLLGHSAGGVDLVRLRARAPGRARRPHLRELRVRGAGARLRAGRDQGAEPHRAARPRAEAEERGLLARPDGGARRMNSDPLIANEVAADASPSPSWCGPTSGSSDEFPLHHAAGAHPARHRRQGHRVPDGSQFFYDTAGSTDKTLKLYEGHVHDLLNDVGKRAGDGRHHRLD